MLVMRAKDHESLAEFMVEMGLEGGNVTAVLFYEDAIELMRELIKFEEVFPESVDISSFDFNAYDKEYYVALLGGESIELYVQPAFVDGRYMKDGPDVMLIDADANSRIMQDMPENMCYELHIGECDDEDECCCDCEEHHCACDECQDRIHKQDEEVLEYLRWRLFEF